MFLSHTVLPTPLVSPQHSTFPNLVSTVAERTVLLPPLISGARGTPRRVRAIIVPTSPTRRFFPNARHAPVTEVLVERPGVEEHDIHVGDITGIPPTNVLVEGFVLVCEQHRHIGYVAGVPEGREKKSEKVSLERKIGMIQKGGWGEYSSKSKSTVRRRPLPPPQFHQLERVETTLL